jgi:hypothetical protein
MYMYLAHLNGYNLANKFSVDERQVVFLCVIKVKTETLISFSPQLPAIADHGVYSVRSKLSYSETTKINLITSRTLK